MKYVNFMKLLLLDSSLTTLQEVFDTKSPTHKFTEFQNIEYLKFRLADGLIEILIFWKEYHIFVQIANALSSQYYFVVIFNNSIFQKYVTLTFRFRVL